jgi:hypothetical protein
MDLKHIDITSIKLYRDVRIDVTTYITYSVTGRPRGAGEVMRADGSNIDGSYVGAGCNTRRGSESHQQRRSRADVSSSRSYVCQGSWHTCHVLWQSAHTRPWTVTYSFNKYISRESLKKGDLNIILNLFIKVGLEDLDVSIIYNLL